MLSNTKIKMSVAVEKFNRFIFKYGGGRGGRGGGGGGGGRQYIIITIRERRVWTP